MLNLIAFFFLVILITTKIRLSAKYLNLCFFIFKQMNDYIYYLFLLITFIYI